MINRIFSDKYVNHAAVTNNYLLLLMYRFAYPFACLLNRLGLSPNQITTQSLLFTVLAFFSLVYDEGWVLFCLFWGVAVLLDFCDGTVARMANNISKSAFRYDHMSDLFKLSLVILGAGLRYDDRLVWLMAFSSSFCFMYLTVVNHDIGSINRYVRKAGAQEGMENPQAPRLRERYWVIAWIVKNDKSNWALKIFWNVHSALLTINGHTLLLLLMLPFGAEFAMVIFGYFILVSLNVLRISVSQLIGMRR